MVSETFVLVMRSSASATLVIFEGLSKPFPDRVRVVRSRGRSHKAAASYGWLWAGSPNRCLAGQECRGADRRRMPCQRSTPPDRLLRATAPRKSTRDLHLE